MDFWSSTEFNESNAYLRALTNTSDKVLRTINKELGFSLRCIYNDSINQSPEIPSNPTPADSSTNQNTTITLSWTCTDPDGDPVTFDIYFDTISNPTTILASDHSATSYSMLYSLEPAYTYYWKIVARDDEGKTTEGEIWEFRTRDWQCGDGMDYEGQTYSTVLIGSQCWFSENLKTTTYSNGTPIPNVTDNTAWSNLTTGAYAWYNNNISWKESYGAMYNWHATVDVNGLCPTGWHVPTNDEWTALTNFIGGTESGRELKSCRQVNSPQSGSCNTSEHPRWNEYSSNWGTDDYGFSCLPGGNRYFGGTFDNVGEQGYWWSSTEHPSGEAWYRSLNYTVGYIGEHISSEQDGFSVRCLKD